MQSMQSIAIIGAGPSGIAAAKAALECGLEPTVLEKASEVGGLWKPTGSVWDSMQTNLSYHSCAFSDMPWQSTSGNFPRQNEVFEYLKQYATVNKIMPHIHFEAEAKRVQRNEQKWKVVWLHKDTTIEKEFDFLIISSGIFSRAYIPDIAGLQTFSGQLLHSQQYKNPLPFKDKVVAVIGNSFSGTEIAAEVASQAKKIIHIASRALWVLPRNLPTGSSTMPLDLVFYSRASVAKSKGLEPSVKNERVFNWFKGLTKQHEVCAELQVTHAPADPSFVAISDTYIDRIKESKIELVRSRVKEIGEASITTEDDRSFAVDSIIFATGYECSLPYFDEQLLQTVEYRREDRLQPLVLHKCLFHPSLPNLAFVGMYRGPYFATMELQARLACHVFAQIVPSPTLEAMREGIAFEKRIRTLVPRPQFPHGNYVEFADELAELAGVMPDLERLKMEDPVLHKKLWEGPLVAAHYRLQGFANNPGIAIPLIEAVNPAQAGQ